MAVAKEEILETIGNMSVLEIVDLISAMEDKFGVTAAVAMAAAPAAGAAATATAAADTPNFSSMAEIRSTTSKTLMLPMVSKISSFATAMMMTPKIYLKNK